MSRSCTVCFHAAREAVDAAIVEKQPYRAIARQYGLSKDAVARHVAHVSPALQAIQAVKVEAGATSLLDRVESLIRRAEAFLAAAEQGGQVAQGLAAIREIRALLELLGRSSGELKDQPAVAINLLASPEIVELTTTLLRALAPYPEARVAAAAALEAIGQ